MRESVVKDNPKASGVPTGETEFSYTDAEGCGKSNSERQGRELTFGHVKCEELITKHPKRDLGS